MMESSGGTIDPLLVPGFRFYPTEEELLTFYLRHRLAGTKPVVEHLIPVVDIYGYHPSELQAMAGAANVSDTEQWFFFCPRAERELHGGRPARTTPSGYWKATGSPSFVYSSASPATSRVIGEKRTMVFYQGRAPTGNKTRWKMNEYKSVAADDDAGDVAPPSAPIVLRNEYSVCRVYISTGTLRSFDRRPLNPPGTGGLAVVAAQRAVQHCGYQQRQRQQPPLPPAAAVATTTTSQHHHQQIHGVVVDGAEDDAATAIDWDALSLIPPVDDLDFSGVDDLARVVIGPHN